MVNFIETGDLAAWGDRQRAAGLRIGFTCGAFDLLHAGHVDYLERARALCDTLIVAVNSDASIRQYKSALRPIQPQEQRLRVIAGLRSVDAVTLLDHPRPLPLIELIKPHLYIKGGDYAPSKLRSASALAAWGGEAVAIPVQFESSTTQIMERISLIALHAEPEAPPPVATRGMLLLDRDGTIIKLIPFLRDPARVELVPGAAECLARLQALGLRLAIVTNQQGIGVGYFSFDEFVAVNQAMMRLLGASGVKISRIYFCPHSLAEECTCRKPGTRMLERAMRDFAVPQERMLMIGDTKADSGAAAALGISSFQIDERNPESWPSVAAKVEAAVWAWEPNR